MKKLLFVVCLAWLPFIALAQFALRGIVTDEHQKPMSGANIKIKNSKTAVSSNYEGKFSIENLSAGNYTILISYLGYNSVEQKIQLKENHDLKINLKPQNFLVGEVIVQATRANEKTATTYKNISKEEIEANNFGQDLPFILQNTPGVVATSDAGAGIGYTGIRIRGSDATRVNVTLNGIPYNDSESQGTFWVNMPDFASSVDNIQIQRGAGTSTNGAGAFGGSLNIQTADGALEPYAEVNNSFGSFNTFKNTVKVGTGLLNNKLSVEGRLSRISSDGYVDRGASLLKSYFLSASYRTQKDLIKMNVFGGSERTYQSWNGIPESRLRNDQQGMLDYIDRNGLSTDDAQNLLNSGRRYNSFTYKDQTDNYWQDHYQFLYSRKISDKFAFNGALHYTDGKGYFEEFKNQERFSKYGLEDVNIGGTTISRTDLARRRWLDNDFYGLTYAFNYNPKTNFNMTLGGAYNEYAGKHFGQVIWAQYASNSNSEKEYYNNDVFKNDFNTYFKVNYGFTDRLNAFVDFQYRRIFYEVNGTDKNINALNFTDRLNFFNPKLGLTYFLNKESNLYASYSIANKEPSRDDYINAQRGVLPKSERLYDTELGYRFKNSKFNIGANVYYMDYKDQLVTTGKVNDVGEYYRQNVADSYRLGLEVDFSYTISKKWLFNANSAWSRNKIKNFIEYIDDYDVGGQMEVEFKNTDISFSPNVVSFAELVFKPAKAVALAFQTKYVGKQYLDNTQNEARKLDGYWTSNLRLGYDFKAFGLRNINVSTLVNNIFNKQFESNGYTYGYLSGGRMVRENFYFPQAGTNLLLNLNVKF